MSRVFKVVYYLRDCITFWAIQTNNESFDDTIDNIDEVSDSLDNDPEDMAFSDEGRGLRTESILRALIRIPVRWFHLGYHARRIERSLNQEHPECPVRIKVVDTLVGTPFIENTFDVGLITIPCMFLFSFGLWAASRFYAQSILEPASMVAVLISVASFVVFGLIFVFASFFGYEFEYLDGKKYTRRKRNPLDSYHKIA